ncbi:MAG: Crp/Fnr family transcriptional regulator [Thainema sp.]
MNVWKNQFNLSDSQSFCTGTDLLSYHVPRQPEFAPDSSDPPLIDPSERGHLIVKGRVRLLCNSDQREQPYSATVLTAGDLIGIDHWFGSAPLSYQAVAASDCELTAVSYSQLTHLMDQYPALRIHWHQQMRRRTQRIFFKRYTSLQSLPTKILNCLLLPRLQEISLAAGSLLSSALLPDEGYFWLRSGELSCLSDPEQTLPMGSGWTGWCDRTRSLDDWVARTPSLIYHLQVQPWETAEILPILEKLALSATDGINAEC